MKHKTMHSKIIALACGAFVFITLLLTTQAQGQSCPCKVLYRQNLTKKSDTPETTVGRVMDSAEKVRPLAVGDKAPTVKIKDIEGKTVSLGDLYVSGPTVLIFFRGGWCPFCNRHLAKLQEIKQDLIDECVRIVAISPDLPEFTKQAVKDQELDYLLLSDAKAGAIKAFGLAFRLDDATNARYLEMGIDLEKQSGLTHHILPVPAAYVIDSEGVIRFVHWDADYKKRVDNEALLKATRAANGKKKVAP